MAFTYDQIFAVDPSNVERVASDGVVTIYAPGDASRTPLTITTTYGTPLANPIRVNENGFGPPFMHETLDRVAWSGGGLDGFFTSYEGIKNVAVAAQRAAEDIQRRLTNGELTPGTGGGGGTVAGSVRYVTGGPTVPRPVQGDDVMVIFLTSGTQPPNNMIPEVDLWIQR